MVDIKIWFFNWKIIGWVRDYLLPYNSIFWTRKLCSKSFDSEIASAACVAARHVILSSNKFDVTCKSASEDGITSTIGCIQIFRDSQTSLSAGSLKFYPLHVITLNINEEKRRRQIVNWNIIVAFLPTNFCIQRSLSVLPQSRQNKNTKTTKLDSLNEL